MALFLISYDINEKDAFEYDALWNNLKDMGAQRILYSEWIVSGRSSIDVYDQIAPLMQRKDRLLVLEITNNAAWDKLLISDDSFRAWIARHARG